jgi:hypothetical protein
MLAMFVSQEHSSKEAFLKRKRLSNLAYVFKEGKSASGLFGFSSLAMFFSHEHSSKEELSKRRGFSTLAYVFSLVREFTLIAVPACSIS